MLNLIIDKNRMSFITIDYFIIIIKSSFFIFFNIIRIGYGSTYLMNIFIAVGIYVAIFISNFILKSADFILMLIYFIPSTLFKETTFFVYIKI